jgi:hypothetical protein
MLAPTYNYIETDFATATETCAEYRRRRSENRRPRGLRRLFAH